MIQLPRAPALSCSRPETARKSAKPSAISSSDAPAALAAAAAASALPMLCAPPAFSMMARSPKGRDQGKARGELAALDALKNILRREIRVGVHAEGHDALRAGYAAPIAGVGVIRVDDGGALRAKAGHGFALAFRHAIQIAEPFADARRRRW